MPDQECVHVPKQSLEIEERQGLKKHFEVLSSLTLFHIGHQSLKYYLDKSNLDAFYELNISRFRTFF